ncbi:MAG: hypothetical protein CL828_08380 [Crocinitomicaceae bacterium]|nr:hypothetical protein [Crocinitomicaceae bacterium]
MAGSMNMLRLRKLILAMCAVAAVQQAFGQPTIGTLIMEPGANQDYVLFSPSGSETTYLIDKCGRHIHNWETEGRPGLMAYFMENGDLVRTRRHQTGQFLGGGIGGILERFNWEGDLLWTDTLATFSQHQHHDIAIMPNGNILAILWEKWSAEDAIERGQLPELASEEVWVTRVVELAPQPSTGSEVVWSWSPWEHLIQNTDPALPNYGEPSDHPERFDINFEAVAEAGGPGFGQEAAYDWMHVNSIQYHPERDEIVLSSRHWSEVWIIDHSTTTEEAAGSSGGQHGKGGDLLWRWGNPAAYGQGDEGDQTFFGQHDAQFISNPEGLRISAYNNGVGRPDGNYSTVQQIQVPLDEESGFAYPINGTFGPEAATWTYPTIPDFTFYSPNISGYTQLSDGHHLICQGAKGRFFELDEAGNLVWEYFNPITSTGPLAQGSNPVQNAVFRVTSIPTSHPGLAGRDLEPDTPLELNPLPLDCSVDLEDAELSEAVLLWPNPASYSLTIGNLRPAVPTNIKICDATGQVHWTGTVTHKATVDIRFWPPGMYVAILQRLKSDTHPATSITLKFLVQ